MTVALGIASRMIVGAIGFSSSMRVRVSISARSRARLRVRVLVLAARDGRRGNLENPTRVLRGCRLHVSGRDSSPVRHDSAAEDCMTGAPSRSPFIYARQRRGSNDKI